MTVVDEPVYKSELFFGLGYMAGFYSQIQNSPTITNTTTETSLIGVGVGTLAVPANTLQVGNAFIVRMGGFLSALNNEPITINLKSNGSILATTGVISLNTTTNLIWQMDITFVVRGVGSAGAASLENHFVFSYEENANDKFTSHAVDVVNNTTFDTGILNTLEITATWGNAIVGNSIYSTVFNLNKMY
jgi:hypothetical protein